MLTNARFSSLAVSACVTAALVTVLTPGSAGAQAAAPGTVTIDRTGQIAPNGTITLTGTYRCSPPQPGPVLVGVKLTQEGATASVGGTTARCDGKLHTWRNTGPTESPFVPGAAHGEATLFGLDSSDGLGPLPFFLDTDGQDLNLRQSLDSRQREQRKGQQKAPACLRPGPSASVPPLVPLVPRVSAAFRIPLPRD
ncbi:DUF6299 family protein [Streptomyces sp. NPDC052236]|uniref:DUF6299 family protein n=1 Tax=Streptomyces sp. NPDC052236 TaxID=3365686 RepID=UPI0037D126E7